jgi:D-3-phosphoglycerate dehydrogenase / 2-oxoglutarate reductase
VLRDGGWLVMQGVELRGKTLGLVGLGGIGREMARLGKGIGLNVIASNRSAIKDAPVPMVPIVELLAQSDVMVGSSRKLPGSAVGEWQPDAMAILQSDRIKGMSAAQVAKLIEEATGQVTTKNAVIGKLNRLRQERQRAQLQEDLAKSGTKLKASGVPAPNGDTERGRRSWPILDRINFLGGY